MDGWRENFDGRRSGRWGGLLRVLGLAWVLVAVSCGGTVGEKSPPRKLDAGSGRMKWFYAGTMAGGFEGKTAGNFRDGGIDLRIQAGGPDNSAVKLVAAGTDMFGVAGADEVLQARAKGIPVVAIMVLFKDSPIAFISKAVDKIKTPADWTGKVVEVSYGSNAELQYRALKEAFKATPRKEIPYTFNLAPFIQGRADVSVAYAMDQVTTLRRMGININVMLAKDFNINPYGDVVIATESTLAEQPDLVKRFVKATRESMRRAIENPEEAVDALCQAEPTLSVENETAVWKATIPFLLGNDGVDAIGVMKDNRWRDTWDIVKHYGLLSNGDSWSQAYRNIVP